MFWFLGAILSFIELQGDLGSIKERNQTFINETLLGQGLIFDVMMHSLDAIKCVDGHKIYLKTERILPSEEGMMLIGDDSSLILLPKVYSDQYGCYLKSSLMCQSCGFELPEGISNCGEETILDGS